MTKINWKTRMDEDDKILDEDGIMFKVKQFRADGITGSANLYDRMGKADDFRNGKQWDPAVKAENERKGKFCLTIPLVKPTIKQVVGNEIQSPKDVKVRNTQNGSATVANVLTALAKHARDSEQVRFESSLRYDSGITTGVGVMGYFVDKSEDPRNGNLRIEKLNEFEVCFDPNCTVYDPNTRRIGCQYVIWEPWVIKEEIEEQYPKKKTELRALGSGRTTGMVLGAVSAIIDWVVGVDSQKGTTLSGLEREDVTSLEKYRYKVNHTWWLEPKRCILVYDEERSEIDSRLITKDAEIAKIKKAVEKGSGRFSFEEIVRPVMHHTIRVGDVFLEDIVDELNGVTMFPLVPFYAYFANGYKSGMAEDMIGLQEAINWGHSMVCNLLKKLANTGWIGKKIGDVYKRFLKAHGGEDGVILDKSKTGGELEKVKPNPFPDGLAIFTEQSIENLKRVTNVRTEEPSTDKDRVASAIALKQEAAKTGHASIDMNHDYTLAIEGNLLIEIIRNNGIYSEDEVRAIVDEEELIDSALMDQARQMVIQQLSENGYEMPEQSPGPDMDLLGQFDTEVQKSVMLGVQQEAEEMNRMQQYIDQAARPVAEQMLLEELKNLKKGKYNTKVTMSPMAPTHRIAKAAELFELNKALTENQQLPIGRSLLIAATDVDNKDEIIADGERQMQQMAQTVGAA